MCGMDMTSSWRTDLQFMVVSCGTVRYRRNNFDKNWSQQVSIHFTVNLPLINWLRLISFRYVLVVALSWVHAGILAMHGDHATECLT